MATGELEEVVRRRLIPEMLMWQSEPEIFLSVELGQSGLRNQWLVVRMEIPTTNLGFAIAARARRKCVETIATTSDYKYRKWTPKPEILISLEL